MPSRPNYTFKFGTKFSEQHIDKFSNDFYTEYPRIKKDNGIFIFDLSSLSWMSNQELLVLTGLLQYLLYESVSFKVYFLKLGSSTEVDRRKASQIVQIWDVWKIYQIIGDFEVNDFFDIDDRIVTAFKRQYNINSATQEIYNRYGVTPFVSLDKIKNFDDNIVHKMMNDVYKLSSATNQILRTHNCLMPFESQTLSSIITKELYENFLDHFNTSLFATEENSCFLSLSLRAKLPAQAGLQKILERNFNEELIPELKNFYYDNKSSKYKNESILQFSFVDFGEGISHTLFDQYKKNKSSTTTSDIDSHVLAYSFHFDSSKDPIEERYLKSSFVPRGLFDLISIVQRFNGLLIARSNKGRVMFDFSDNNSVEESISYFGNGEDYFPGTLISIYIPERDNDRKIATSVIKPEEQKLDGLFLSKEIKHVSLLEIQKKIKATTIDKQEIYNVLFKTLTEELISSSQNCLIYLDFKGYEIDERISRKIIFFLVSDYNFNLRNSLIVLNPPELPFLDNIKKEINALSEVILQYKVHPLPFVSYNVSERTLSIYWLGVYSNSDIDKLNQLLFEMHDLRRSDFEKPSDIIGNVNYYDEYGNLKSILNRDSLIKGFSKEIAGAQKIEVQRIVESCILRLPYTLFLCVGNYYQHEYIQMFNALSDLNNCNFLANALFEKIDGQKNRLDGCKFLSLTTNSSKIISSLLLSDKITKEQVVKCNDYQALLDGKEFSENIKKDDKLMLVCDVNSTGFVIEKLDNILERVGAKLVQIAVLVNAIDKGFESEKMNYSSIESRMISLYDYPMRKFRRTFIKTELVKETTKVVRVHPYTYAPILGTLPAMSNPGSENLESRILLTNQEFVDIIGEDSIKAGYYKFNNLIHPYFFDMDSILGEPKTSSVLLKKIFSRIPRQLLTDIKIIFYPKDSGIRNMKFDLIKNEILKDQDVKFCELERFETGEGWRFPHPPIFYEQISEDKHVLILDDGSCSGESLIQMIDEVTSINVKQILILSIIGRINDHKRDFFTRINSLTNKNDLDKEKTIKVDIFFGSHWHIPTYYIEESPVIQEKKWLEDIFNYPNIPEKIKRISLNIIDELKVKKIEEVSNRFLLRTKDGKNIVKDLILRKEEIGKVSTYRFYKEYFYFFDDIIKTYETNNGNISQRYKKIELVCAVFLHEPYLFKKIRLVLPDLTEKLEEFIQTILFGNPNKDKNPRLLKENLFYKWTNKDLIHLLFIIFDQHRLSNLLDAIKLASIITEFCEQDTDLNYLFFKLLKYFPISRINEENLKYSGDIINRINAVIDNQLVSPDKIKKIKRFRSFTTTLPYQYDFISALTLVKNNYSKLTDEAHHKESLNVQWDIIESQLDVLTAAYSEETEQIILSTWEKISPFIADLLSFSKAYPTYFAACSDRVYNKLEIQGNSLRALHGEITELIFNLNITSNIPRIQEILIKIYSVFISSESDYYKIFNESSATDIATYYLQFIERLQRTHSNIQSTDIPFSTILISTPSFFVEEAFEEITQNLRHADTKSNISFSWSLNSSYLTLKIENRILEGIKVPTDGGGNGISKLESLNNMPDKEIQYVQMVESQNFIQLLKFKKI